MQRSGSRITASAPPRTLRFARTCATCALRASAACTGIEEYQKRIDARQACYVVQTVRELEDEFDGETMMDAEREHKTRVLELSRRLAAEGIDAFTLAAGTCTICEKCTCPDAPCRHPESRLVSLEAAGLMVYQVCEVAGVPYNHGPLTIAYTSAVLL